MTITNSGCPVCETGSYPSFSLGNNLCEKHDVCISCGIKRADLDHTPWGSRLGAFQCAPCEKAQRKSDVKNKISNGFEHEYTYEVVCPHCGYTHSDSWEMHEGEADCPDCEKSFSISRDVNVTYSTKKLEKNK
jgi:hypothetical protein